MLVHGRLETCLSVIKEARSEKCTPGGPNCNSEIEVN